MMCIDVFVQFLHKLTARALIGDYEDGNLETSEAEHEVCLCVSLSKTKITPPPPKFRHPL